MEKLNLKKSDTYKLEVNDNGEYIEFDLTDISLPEKIMIASENIKKINDEYINNLLLINQETDEVVKTEKAIELEKEKCRQLRIEFDSFLGEGACQKIFGNKNQYGMFENLFEALEEHFSKMEINIKKAKEKLVQKYLLKDKSVI